MTKPHVAIICNPLSGKGKPLLLLNNLTSFVTEHQGTFEIFKQDLPANLHGFSDIIIMGGDGTINYTLNHFKEINIPIGIIPCGTGNDIAHLLLGKRTLPQYLACALHGKVNMVDAGECNGRLFLNGAGIGFDGWVARLMQGKKIFSGITGYYLTVLRLLLFFKETLVELTIDGQHLQTDLFMFSAANGVTYGGGFKVAPFAKIDDGVLEVITVKKIGLLTRLRYLPVIEKGKHLNNPLPFIHYVQGKQITITSNQPLQAHLDGEWLQSNTFEIKLLEKKYKIRV
jgi:diacylglycerol kinase (ATP)